MCLASISLIKISCGFCLRQTRINDPIFTSQNNVLMVAVAHNLPKSIKLNWIGKQCRPRKLHRHNHQQTRCQAGAPYPILSTKSCLNWAVHSTESPIASSSGTACHKLSKVKRPSCVVHKTNSITWHGYAATTLHPSALYSHVSFRCKTIARATHLISVLVMCLLACLLAQLVTPTITGTHYHAKHV